MCVAAMTIILSTWLAIPPYPACGEPLIWHLCRYAILRFRKTYANVKWSSISNSNEELGSDPETFRSFTSRVRRKGAAE